jgi:hypothetical protein
LRVVLTVVSSFVHAASTCLARLAHWPSGIGTPIQQIEVVVALGDGPLARRAPLSRMKPLGT